MTDQFWKNRRILITGASGIVGSWLVKRMLEEGSQVAVLLRDWDPQSELLRAGLIQETSVISAELQDYAGVLRAINQKDIQVIFHLGAQTQVGAALQSPLETFESNIRGTYHLLEACRLVGSELQAVVVASSDKAYGSSDRLPYREVMPLQGRHPYDVSKSCTDLLSMTYAESYDLPVSIARCGNIYGGGDLNWNRIVPGTIRSLLRNEPPIIRSDGEFIRDYIYVEDVVDAYLLLARQTIERQLKGEAYNFSLEKRVKVIDMTEAIARLLDRTDLKPRILDRAHSEIRDQYLDASKAKNELGWRARFDLLGGLEKTITWYRDYLDREPAISR